jgi:hypothetical protein
MDFGGERHLRGCCSTYVLARGGVANDVRRSDLTQDTRRKSKMLVINAAVREQARLDKESSRIGWLGWRSIGSRLDQLMIDL